MVVETKGLGRLLFERDLDARFGGVGGWSLLLLHACTHSAFRQSIERHLEINQNGKGNSRFLLDSYSLTVDEIEEVGMLHYEIMGITNMDNTRNTQTPRSLTMARYIRREQKERKQDQKKEKKKKKKPHLPAPPLRSVTFSPIAMPIGLHYLQHQPVVLHTRRPS